MFQGFKNIKNNKKKVLKFISKKIKFINFLEKSLKNLIKSYKKLKFFIHKKLINRVNINKNYFVVVKQLNILKTLRKILFFQIFLFMAFF